MSSQQYGAEAGMFAKILLYLSLEHCEEFLLSIPNFSVLLTGAPVTAGVALTPLNILSVVLLGHGTSLISHLVSLVNQNWVKCIRGDSNREEYSECKNCKHRQASALQCK